MLRSRPTCSPFSADRVLRVLAALFLSLSGAGAAESGVKVLEEGGKVTVTWPVSANETGTAVFNMDEAKPLIDSLGVALNGEPVIPVVRKMNPVTVLTVGSRDLKHQAGWGAFFDNPRKRPHQTYQLELGKRAMQVDSEGAHTTVRVAAVAGGGFAGDMRFTFYRNCAFVVAEAVVSTENDGCAIVYDAGLSSANPSWKSIVVNATEGTLQRAKLDPDKESTPLAVEGRTIVAESDAGSLAVFPAPHRYFYPLDEAFNLKFVWHGRNYRGLVKDYGLGVRQELEGDNRWVPWFSAPPKSRQELGVFYLLSRGDGKQALDSVAGYTRGDRYKEVPGYKSFTSHYHVEHTLELVRKRKEQNTNGIPKDLEVPGMIKTFKKRGVNIVHLAEFHVGETPNMKDTERLPLLKTLHDECDRLSDDSLLMLPGEEPNVHLGGHWISFFPKPVYWVLNRSSEQPFVEQVDGYGKVYHVGSPEDVLKLMEEENGLMWTAHARIKASFGFPDRYKIRDFFNSDHFMGAAWKAMPADLSRPTLGWRVLDLLDDMSNWGMRKQVIAEADLFRMEPDFETYAHMNINYVQLDKLPRFKDGWQPVLNSLRKGRFFTTTGEILIPEFKVGGKSSGDVIDEGASGTVLEASLEWTFPMSFVEIVSGDGRQVFRQRVDLGNTGSFGNQKLSIPLDLTGRTWVRLEAWDIAANGAFTQPVWIGPKVAPDWQN